MTGAVERLLLRRRESALDRMSKLAALESAQKDTWLPGSMASGETPDRLPSMDFLFDCNEEIQPEVYFVVANVLNLEGRPDSY